MVTRATRSTQRNASVEEKEDDIEDSDTEETEEEEESDAKPAEEEAPPNAPNGLNELALKTLNDVVEYFAEMIMVDRNNRQENLVALSFYWNLHPANGILFGRGFTKTSMALLLADICGTPPYGYKVDADQKSTSDIPMVKWDRERWELAREDLIDCSQHLLRKDATIELSGNQHEATLAEDDDEHDGRKLSHFFSNKLDTVLQIIDINMAIAPIRESLQEQMDEEKEGKPKIAKEVLKELVQYVQGMENQHDQLAVKELFDKELFEEETGKGSAKKRAATLGLISIDQIYSILSEKPFGLDFVQNKIESLLHKWNNEVYGKEDPTLIQLRYNMPEHVAAGLLTPRAIRKSATKTDESEHAGAGLITPRAIRKSTTTTDEFYDARTDLEPAKQPAKTQAELEELRKDRAALNTKHGADPLAASRAAAAAAGRGVARKRTAQELASDDENGPSRGGKLLEKKKSATQLRFDDDDDDDDEYEKITLSELASAAKKPKSAAKGVPPDKGIYSPSGKVQRRRAWTEEETNAVRLGFQKLGGGQWANIKAMYPDALRNRNSVQIKDKWRNLVNSHSA